MYKKAFIIFICFQTLLFGENQNFLLTKAIVFFEEGKIANAKTYLRAINNSDIEKSKNYIKLNFLISAIERNTFLSGTYFEKLINEKLYDDFSLYIKILELLENNEFQSIEKYISLFQGNQTFEKKASIGFFSCPLEFPNYWFKFHSQNYKYMWREFLTEKEKEFIFWLKQFYESKDTSYIQKEILECIEKNPKEASQTYRYYRLLIKIDSDNNYTFDFYLFLKNQNKYLESLHVLRKLYYGNHYSPKDKEFFLILHEFKNIYLKLGYISQSNILERFLKVLEESYIKNHLDWVELKKIAGSHLKLRELLWFMYLYSNNKDFYVSKLQEYDHEFNMKEKIFYYKEIYPY